MKYLICRLLDLKKFYVFYPDISKYTVPMTYTEAKIYAEIFKGVVKLIPNIKQEEQSGLNK